MESVQGMVVPTCNPSTQKAQQEGQREVEASLGSTTSPVSETTNANPKAQKMEKNWPLTPVIPCPFWLGSADSFEVYVVHDGRKEGRKAVFPQSEGSILQLF